MHLDLQAHPPQAAILSTYFERTAGQHQQSTAWTFFSPGTGAHAAGCHPGPHSQHCRRRVRGPGGAQGHAPPGMPFASNLFLCPLLPALGAKPATQRVAMRQLRPPETRLLHVRNRQPESFVFREKRYTVERAYGPWSSGGDWWKPTLWSLEQWDLVARAHHSAEHASWLCCCLTRDLHSGSLAGRGAL